MSCSVSHRAKSTEMNRYLNAPSPSHSGQRPQTHRRPADSKQPADTHLTHTDGYHGYCKLMQGGYCGYTEGCMGLLWLLYGIQDGCYGH